MDKLLKASYRPGSPQVNVAIARLATARVGAIREKATHTLDLPPVPKEDPCHK
jgi:hypothetical protein